MSVPTLVLLDRDGTINVNPPEGDYVRDPAELALLPRAAAAVRRLNEAGVPVAVVTNQRGIALGRMTEDDLAAVHERLRALLAREGAHLDAIHHCPHEEGECDCRKPAPGMLLAAAAALGAPLDGAVMIGDTARDMEAGRRAGARTVLLARAGAPGLPEADAVVPDLATAVGLVLAVQSADRALD